jgi:hypothetical protein
LTNRDPHGLVILTHPGVFEVSYTGAEEWVDGKDGVLAPTYEKRACAWKKRDSKLVRWNEEN